MTAKTELDNITEFIKSPAFALMSDSVKKETLSKQKEIGMSTIQKVIDEQIMPIIAKNDLKLKVSVDECEEIITSDNKPAETKKELSFDDIIKVYPQYQGMILTKEIDWSLLNHGFTVPKVFHAAIEFACGQKIEPSTSKQISVFFDKKLYPASVERDKNGVLQFGFSKILAKALQAAYAETFEFMKVEKAKATNKKMKIKLPNELMHKFCLCSCKSHNEFILFEE